MESVLDFMKAIESAEVKELSLLESYNTTSPTPTSSPKALAKAAVPLVMVIVFVSGELLLSKAEVAEGPTER